MLGTMIDFRQIRAARALLNWSQADLARAAEMATSSIKAIECEAASARRETLAQISAAFDRHGIEFLPQAGVRLKNETLVVLDGRDCVARLLDTIEAETIAHRVREVLVLGLDLSLAAETDGLAPYRRHHERLTAAGITQRILVPEAATRVASPSACYRLLPATRSLSTATITVFGNSVATLTGSLKRRAFVVGNRAHAEHMRAVFDLLWTEVARVPDGQRAPEILRRIG